MEDYSDIPVINKLWNDVFVIYYRSHASS